MLMKVQLKSWWMRLAGGRVLWTCLLLVAVGSQPAWTLARHRAQRGNCSMQGADCCGMPSADEAAATAEPVGCCAPESQGPVIVDPESNASCGCQWDAGPTSTPRSVLWHSRASSWGDSGTAKRWLDGHFDIAFKSLHWTSIQGLSLAIPEPPGEDSSCLASSRGSSCLWNRLRRGSAGYLAFLSIARI